MTHFAVVAPPFPSHFRVFQALALALVERGHRVTFFHQVDAAAWLGDTRVGFQAIGQQSHPPGSLAATLRCAARPGGPLGLRRLIGDMARTTDMLCRELPAQLDALGVEAMLCDQMEAAGGLVAEATGRPFVSLACALPINREPGVPLPVMPMAYEDSERARHIYQGSTRVYDWLMGAHRQMVARHARGFGLSARDGLHECLSPTAQISQTLAGFEFPRHELPAHFHHVGPLRSAEEVSRPLGLEVDPSRPLVFASLGTLQGQRFGLFKRIARACAGLDVQLLLAHCGGLNPQQERRLQRAGATWVTDFAPQQAALERADAVVTHGGMNTVLDAVATRTPMLVTPIAFDQAGVAARVLHARVGLRASAHLAGVRTLRGALQQLLEGSAFQPGLERLRQEVLAAGGTRMAADIVEAAMRSGRPVLTEHAA
jgi:zeaxanthin glucosyltransferase